MTDGRIVLREAIDRRNGYHDEDAAALSQLSPDHWSDPLHIELGWREELERSAGEQLVLARKELDGAAASPVRLRDWLRYFAP